MIPLLLVSVPSLRHERRTYAKEIERMTSAFNAQLAAKQNEINALKGIDDGDAPTTTMPGSSSSSAMHIESKLRKGQVGGLT